MFYSQVDRLIIPFLLECEPEKSKNVADVKEDWIKECVKCFPSRDHNKGRFGALVIICTHSTLLFLFSLTALVAKSGISLKLS